MSLDKGIAHGKEYRRRYYRSGRFDRTCRPGGGCPYCKGNRTHARRRAVGTRRDVLVELDGEALAAAMSAAFEKLLRRIDGKG